MGTQVGISGLHAAQNALDVAGNNIANASTMGFKSSRSEFRDVYPVGTLGVASNAVGMGTKLSGVTQNLGQGPINETARNLDLAIGGQGFFILKDGGSTVYSKAGAFSVDPQSNALRNSLGQLLQGYSADSNGVIQSVLGNVQINNGNIPAQATTDVSLQVNLSAKRALPSTPFNPSNRNSYNDSQPMTIYDSLGNAHTLTTYFVKGNYPNVWHMHVGIDGADVTPRAATVPASGQPYPQNTLAQPFTLVFNQNGALIPNGAPPVFHGSSARTAPNDPNRFHSNPSTLTNTNVLATNNALQAGFLTINGVPIRATTNVDDGASRAAQGASSIAIARAINDSTNLHGVTARVSPTDFNLEVTNSTGTALQAGEFSINGVNITGAATTDLPSLVAVINNHSANTHVRAETVVGPGVNTGAIRLIADDGQNITLTTPGGKVGGVVFRDFSLADGALDQTIRGSYDLFVDGNDNDPIVINGNNPAAVGLALGPARGIVYSSSDQIAINNWNPGTGAAVQNLTMNLANSSQQDSDFTVLGNQQNGSSSGRLSSINVGQNGVISASYTNGKTNNLGQIALAWFKNPEGLQPTGNTSWNQTADSGIPNVGVPQQGSLGGLMSGALENSNVDLAQELVNLIIYQRNFQANAQTIKTENSITQTILNIV